MPHLALLDWFDSDLGQYVFRTECRMLAQLLPGFFGYHLLQLSVQDEQMFCSSPVPAKVAVSMSLRRGAGLVASPPSLPFANDSVDVVLVHHLLEFVESPQDILREIGRVTAPAGNLVIVGFNPVSAWGIWQRLARSRGCVPWTGHFIRPRQLMDWLDLLGFKIDQARYAIYRPPLAPSARRLGEHARSRVPKPQPACRLRLPDRRQQAGWRHHLDPSCLGNPAGFWSSEHGGVCKA